MSAIEESRGRPAYAPEAKRLCGHTHDCACGLRLPMAHRDPNYARQGFCAMPCAYCDALNASEAEGGR